MDNWLLIYAHFKGQRRSHRYVIRRSAWSHLCGRRWALLASLPLTITQTNRWCHWNKSWSQKAKTKSAQSLSAINDLEISPAIVRVWLYSQARTHYDAFLSHETLFLKYCPCTIRLYRINKICGRQIYLYLQEVLSSFWILDHFWLSVAPSFCSAVQGLQRARSHNKTRVSIFFSSALTPQTLHAVSHIIP